MYNYDILGVEHAVFPMAIICAHPEDKHYTKVLSAPLNCETTVIACQECGAHLTEPKTDCR